VHYFAFKLNDFAYENSRYINACTDYVENYKTGKNIQHLSKLPGNALNIFASNTSNGVIELNDTLPKLVEIIIKDAAGNSSNLSFYYKKRYSCATNYNHSRYFIVAQYSQ
jgi:membrane-associated HD superfamily phosphohydrolase